MLISNVHSSSICSKLYAVKFKGIISLICLCAEEISVSVIYLIILTFDRKGVTTDASPSLDTHTFLVLDALLSELKWAEITGNVFIYFPCVFAAGFLHSQDWYAVKSRSFRSSLSELVNITWIQLRFTIHIHWRINADDSTDMLVEWFDVLI